MTIDIRTMYVAMATICFIVAVSLFVTNVGRFRKDGALLWALGWAFQGGFWAPAGLQGIMADPVLVVMANTCLTACFSLLYSAVRQFRGRGYSVAMLFFPPVATFIVCSLFAAEVDDLIYRVVLVSLLVMFQIVATCWMLFHDAPLQERRFYWLTGSAFVVGLCMVLIRLIRIFVVPHDQALLTAAPAFRNALVIANFGVAILSSMGFMLMIKGRAELALREGERRFRSLFETSPDAILLVNQETGRILAANPAACRLYGYTEEELITLKNTDISAEPEKTEKAVRESVVAVPLRFHRRKDGTIFPAEIRGSYFTDGVLRLETALVRDITWRKKTEDAIRESETKLRAILDNSRDAIGVSKDGMHAFVNPSYVSLFGYDNADELIGMPTIVLVAPEDRPFVTEMLRKGVAGEQIPSTYELTGLKKDGTRFLIEASVSRHTVRGEEFAVAMLRDITERKKAERQLLVANFGVQSAISAIRFADLEGKITFVNDAFLRLWGYDRPDEVIGRHISEFAMAGMDQEGVKAAVSGQGMIGETLARRKDGSPFHVQAALAPVKTDEGATIGTIASFIDITERKKAEEALRTSRLHLVDAADIARIAYWEHDQEKDEFIFNDAFYDLYGTTAEREGGYRMAREEYMRRFVHPDDLEALRREVEENRYHPRVEINREHEHRAVRRDGEVIYILSRNRAIFDLEGRLLNVIGVNQDITERKKMEDALRESETKLRSILDSSRDAIAVTKNGIHVFVNPAFVSLFGYECADEIIGIPAIDLVATDSRALAMERVRKRAAGEPLPPMHEMTALRKDGTTFLMEATVSHYTVRGDQFRLAILRDITERKKAEQQLLIASFGVQSAISAIGFADLEGKITFVNSAFLRLWGYDRPDEVIGGHISEFAMAGI
jgi:PAS domain S-box-containing protein